MAAYSPSARFGTAMKMKPDAKTVAAASQMKTPRQSVSDKAISTGTVPLRAPRPPAAIWKPLTNGSRSFGTQMA